VRILLLLVFAAAAPAWSQQKALSLEGMSEEQRADYVQLMRAYVDTFRMLGRAKLCRLDLDPAPYLREVARRHGEKSEPVAVAALGYAAGAENHPLSQELAPKPPAPVPCDVMQYVREVRLPDLPASLAPVVAK
jgi:hypothetical protein